MVVFVVPSLFFFEVLLVFLYGRKSLSRINLSFNIRPHSVAFRLITSGSQSMLPNSFLMLPYMLSNCWVFGCIWCWVRYIQTGCIHGRLCPREICIVLSTIPQELESSGSPLVKKSWRYLCSFWCNTRAWQTDGRADRYISAVAILAFA